MKKYDLTPYEVNGTSLIAFLKAMGAHHTLGQKILNEVQLGAKDSKGNYEIESDKWYPMQKGIEVYQKVMDQVGPRTLKNLGMKIPETAIFPPHIVDIHTAIESTNVAYHMNHRKNGVIMFDPATGKKLDGIGYYGYEAVAGQKKIISVCENPYPSELDEGIILGLARRFEPDAMVTLAADKPTRKNGGDSCTYIITS